MYQEGKIWVVITILGIIFIGIAIFLIFMDKKLKKLEKQIEEIGSVSEDENLNKD